MSKRLTRGSRVAAVCLALFVISTVLGTGYGASTAVFAQTTATTVASSGNSGGGSPASKACTAEWGIITPKTSSGAGLTTFLGENYQDKYGGGNDPQAAVHRRYGRLIEKFNTEGGFGGCTIDPVFAPVSLTSADPATSAAEQQAACTTFTEDHDVKLVILIEQYRFYPLADCVRQRGVPVIFGDQSIGTAEWAKAKGKTAAAYEPYDVFAERWGPMVDALDNASFYGSKADRSKAKVGLLVRDDPLDLKLAEDVWKPRLEKLKIPVEIQTFTADSSIAQSMNNAALKFKSDGVTHVMFGAGPVAFFFLQAAKSQDYKPRYAFNSRNNTYFQTFLSPPDQLENSVAVSWNPWLEGIPEDEIPANPAVTACRQIYPKGDDFTSNSATYGWCDAATFGFLAGKKAPSLTARGFAKGVKKLGTDFDSAMVYEGRTSFANGDSGVVSVRVAKYDPVTKLFHLTGTQPQALP
jgi:hypothetical protein